MHAEAHILEDECKRYQNLQLLLQRASQALDLGEEGRVMQLLCQRRLQQMQEQEEEVLMAAAEAGDENADAASGGIHTHSQSMSSGDPTVFMAACLPLMSRLFDRLDVRAEEELPHDGSEGGIRSRRRAITGAGVRAEALWEEAAESPRAGAWQDLAERSVHALLGGIVPLIEAPRNLHPDTLRGLQGSLRYLRAAIEYPRFSHPGSAGGIERDGEWEGEWECSNGEAGEGVLGAWGGAAS